jgi:DNA-binding XRE family transcriptional regulator
VNKFAEWIKNNDKKQRGVAEKLGISTATLYEILKKNLMPNLKIAYKIEKYTRGAITMYDWVDQLGIEEKTVPKIKNITKTNKAIK